MKNEKEFLGCYRPNFPGIVVQSVRAPPCQGGSCGFEPRQSRPRRCKRSIHLSVFCEEGRKRVGYNSQIKLFFRIFHQTKQKKMKIRLIRKKDICRLVQSEVSPYSGFKGIPFVSGFFRLFLISRLV